MKIKKLSNLLKGNESGLNRRIEPYDTQAEVKRIENGIAWVHIAGGVDETPVNLTINAKVGDTVQVRVGGGRAWLTGNKTAPPTDDTKANVAQGTANNARQIAESAVASAEIAADAAERANVSADQAKASANRAEVSANEAKASATEANNQAISATNSANNALGQLGVVESVVDTLTWIAEHSVFTPSTDTSVVASKTYYVPNNQTLTMTDGTYQVSGLTIFIKNGIVTVNGTATADVYFEIGTPSVTAGENIYISGASGGSSQTYGLRYYQAGGSVFVFDGIKKTTAVSGAKFYVYVENGYTATDLIFYPRVSNANDGYEYVIVDSPTGNPTTQGYFELDTDDAVKTYVQTHLALMNDGLYVVKDNSGYKVKINNNGMYVQNPSGGEVAEFSSTAARIGLPTAARFLMGASSLQAYDSSNQKYFEVSANGLTFGTNTAATSTDVTNAISTASADATSKANAAQSAAEATASADATAKANAAQSAAEKVATNYLSYDATNGLDIQYTGTNNRVNIKGDGMTVYANNVDVAKFGTSARIGSVANNQARTIISPDGIDFIRRNNSGVDTTMGHIGYGTVKNASGTTTDGFYITFFGAPSGYTAGLKSFSAGSAWAQGYHSTAFGASTDAQGRSSFVVGEDSRAIGDYSAAFNLYNDAKGDCQTVIGKYCNPNTTSAFIIGNGTRGDLSNALTVDWSGNVNLASGAKYKINGTNLSASDVSAVALSDKYTRSSVGTIDWTNQTDGDAKVIAKSALAFWNGAYSGTSSNLSYCSAGRIIGRNQICYANSRVDSFSSGSYTATLSSFGVTTGAKPVGIILTPESSNAIIMKYNYDSSNSSNIIIQAWNHDGSAFSGNLRYFAVVFQNTWTST